jgi:outer membrane immunogenic protein
MFYATGGVAWADMRYGGLENNSPPAFAANYLSVATFSKVQTGWVAGGGVEYPVTEHVLLRAEYLYYAFDGTTASANLLQIRVDSRWLLTTAGRRRTFRSCG